MHAIRRKILHFLIATLTVCVLVKAFVPNPHRSSSHPFNFSSKNNEGGKSSFLMNAFHDHDRYENSIEWDNTIDSCYLITCPKAEGGELRYKRSLEILNRVELASRTVIKEFDTDDEDRIRGCYMSHIRVLEEAYKNYGSNRQGRIMVIEDNVALTDEDTFRTNEIVSHATSFMTYNDFDVMHLSYICYVPNLVISKTSNSGVVKLSSGIGSSLGTTAYIISVSGIESLLNHHNEYGYYAAIPDVMAEIFPDSRYASYPVPFHRASKVKSLVNPQLDDLRALLFQPSIFLKVQSILIETGLSTNSLLLCVILSLLLLSGLSTMLSLEAAIQITQTGGYNGFVALPIISSFLSLFSLAIIAQGVALAPKPEVASKSN